MFNWQQYVFKVCIRSNVVLVVFNCHRDFLNIIFEVKTNVLQIANH